MSLPWFPFKLKDFLAKTKRLNTEAKGAYLLLMLDYYEREQGPPDDDEVLATICELSPEAWQRHRKVIAPLFEIKDGIWTDRLIEDEIRDGRRRYEQTVAASAAAKAAREAKKTGTNGLRTWEQIPKRSPSRSSQRSPGGGAQFGADEAQKSATEPSRKPLRTPERTSWTVPDTGTVNVTDSGRAIQEQEHSLITREGEKGAPAWFQDGFAEKGTEKDGKHPIPQTDEAVLAPPRSAPSTEVSPDFKPSVAAIDIAHEDGATDAMIGEQVMLFIAWHQERGTLSRNWEATWTLWWGRWREHSKVKPGVEVNNNRPGPARASIGYKPTEAEFDRAAALYAKSGSKWSWQLGPEPGHIGCKCPPDILHRHGIDPETGMKVRSE